MSKTEEIKAERVKALLEDTELKFVQFKGALLYSGKGTRGFIPLTERTFSPLCYARFVGISKAGILDLMHMIAAVAPDWTEHSNKIAFYDKVWDMEKLAWSNSLQYVYSTPIRPNNNTKPVLNYLIQLGNGDKTLAYDYLQSIAVMFMMRKPAGVIWYVGDGANGKSSLINALYRIVGRYLSSLTLAAIEDGRDTPSLIGKLGNVCRESSEGRVEDTERYKAIGTHEPFSVHKFHSQDNIEIQSDFHTIFNANNIPVFNDKTKGARRRTLILPFMAHFADNPTFEDRTFTDEFLGGLITLILEETKVIRDNGYRFKWSDATLRAKEQYDNEVNSAEAYMSYLLQSGIAGFTNYATLRTNYDNWCANAGMLPLGITTLKRVVTQTVNPERKPVRDGGHVFQRYFFVDAANEQLVWLDNGYGMPSVPELPEKVETVATTKPLSEEW